MKIRKRLVVTFVGGITYRKGADRLVSIWSSVLEKYPGSLLILIGPRSAAEGAAGDEFCYEEIRSTIEERNMKDSVRITGRIENVEEYLQVSDLFVLPSSMEGMPNVVLESMSCGVPVVAYRVSGVEDAVIDGVNGRVIGQGDEAGLKDALIELLGDEKSRKDYSAKARERMIKEFSLEFISQRYFDIYRSLL